MKSNPDPADARHMHLLAESAVLESPVMAITAMFAAAVVCIALKSIASEMQYAERLRVLRDQASVLRQKQLERLRNLQSRR